MARCSRREDAIHHIDAEACVFGDFLGSAHSHDIARFVGGKMLQGSLDDFASALPRLADAEASDGITGEADLDGAFGGFFAESQVHAALDYSEEGLSRVSSFRFLVSSVGGTGTWKPETGNCLPWNLMLVLFEILLAALRPA